MATHVFDVTLFRTDFPAFADPIAYPDATLDAYWNAAICYINPNDYSWLNGDCLQRALNLMVAHLAFITPLIIMGQNPSFEVSATIDKISVAVMPPPTTNFWNFWLSSSPYGTQLLALLKVKSIGGFYMGGLPESSAIRKVAGIF
jgi:hypothetical protein